MVAVRYGTAFEIYPYEKSDDQTGPARRHPVVIVGGGPVGLALALDLGQKGTPALVLDDHEGAGLGSKAICFAKRTLDIAHRLGAGQPMLDKGVVWNTGRVFYGDDQLFSAFINLQQPYFEQFLVNAIRDAQSKGAPIEIRGCNAVIGINHDAQYVVIDIETPAGPYQINADYVVACDGARSPVRDILGLSFDGRVFEDNFLIADVKMKADRKRHRHGNRKGTRMTVTLIPNIADPDGFYDELLQAHEGLSDAQSNAYNARLILTLCNHSGDRKIIRAALDAAI